MDYSPVPVLDYSAQRGVLVKMLSRWYRYLGVINYRYASRETHLISN